MEAIEKKTNKIVFRAEIDESVANAIRRYINHIPILAVDEVEISKNDSPLYDETIAHRIGLIPIKTDKAAGEKASLKLSTDKEGMIYSGQMKGNVKVVYDKIPITLINKGQEFELTAYVRSGRGVEHAKFSPGLMFYRSLANVKIEKDCPQEILESAKKNQVKTEGGKIIISDLYGNDLCESAVEKYMKEGKTQIEIVPTEEIIVTVESFGQMEPGEMFKKSIETLKKDLAIVEKKL
ncbi:MAG: DNA-directed RNA polymerase subunit D [Candidatus Pacearchaeota archaeon]